MITAFLVPAIVLVLVAVALVVLPLVRAADGRPATLAAVGVALGLPTVALLGYLSVTSFPWADPPSDPLLATPADSEAVLAGKSGARAAARDAAAWVRLGDALLASERFDDARTAFRRAHELDRRDDAILLSYAEADVLADRSALGGEAGRIIEGVLARSPSNPKALWYGGMVALARGDDAATLDRWSQLLDLGPPAPVREVLIQQIARLAGSAAAPPATAGAAAIALRVRISPDLAKIVAPGAVLFVFAREPGGKGPPLAVVRRSAGEWPQEFSISDADSMVPGRSLAGFEALSLTARVANDGEALPATGDPIGEATWRRGGDQPVELQIDRQVP